MAQPPEVFQLELLHDRRDRLQRPCALISRRTSSWPSVGALAHRLRRRPDCKPSPSVSVSSCSTRPVQEPQEAEALVCGAHVVERGQALRRDRAGDLALADAVAAADLRIIRQGCNGRHRVQRGASLRRPGRRSACRASRRCRPAFFFRSKNQAPSAVSP